MKKVIFPSIAKALFFVVLLFLLTSLEVAKKGNAFFKPNQKTIEIIRQAGNNIRDFSTSTYDLTSAFAATHFAIHGVMLS